MLISHNLKYIFLHNPKCAGISLSNWLIDKFGFEYFNDPEEMIPGKPYVERHRFQIPDWFSDYTSFTTTREPFKRWESFYMFARLYMSETLDFAEFTRQKHDTLPLQKLYTDVADLVFASEDLKTELLQLPFVSESDFPIPRLNQSSSYAGYQQIKDSVVWSDELRQIIYDYFKDDFPDVWDPKSDEMESFTAFINAWYSEPETQMSYEYDYHY